MRPVILIIVLLFCSLEFVQSEEGETLRRNPRTLFAEDIPKNRPLSGNYFAPYIGFPHPNSRSGETGVDHSEEKSDGDLLAEPSSISATSVKFEAVSKSPEKPTKTQKHPHHKVHKYLSTPSTFTNTHTYYYTGADRALLLEYPTTYEAYKSPVLTSKPLPHRRVQHQFHKQTFHPQPQPSTAAPQAVENQHSVVRNDESDDGPKIHLDFVTEPKVILTSRQSHVMNAPHHLKEGSKMVGQFVRRMFTRLTHTRAKSNRNGSFSQHQKSQHQQQQPLGNGQAPIVKLIQNKSHQVENNNNNNMNRRAPIGLKLIMSRK